MQCAVFFYGLFAKLHPIDIQVIVRARVVTGINFFVERINAMRSPIWFVAIPSLYIADPGDNKLAGHAAREQNITERFAVEFGSELANTLSANSPVVFIQSRHPSGRTVARRPLRIRRST
jgi:hypothetical protein